MSIHAQQPPQPFLWWATNHGPQELPLFFTTTPTIQLPNYFGGCVGRLAPLVAKYHVDRTCPQVDVSWLDYTTGVGLRSSMATTHPTQPQNLLTKCIVPPNQGAGFLRDLPDFRLQPHGSRMYGPNRGYVKVRAFAWGEEQDKEFYLHTMLCWLYHGPSPDPACVAGHLCSNKLCMAPWHLYWITQSQNVQMGHNKRHKKHY